MLVPKKLATIKWPTNRIKSYLSLSMRLDYVFFLILGLNKPQLMVNTILIPGNLNYFK